MRIARDEGDVVVTTRPGVFAPLHDVGLVAITGPVLARTVKELLEEPALAL